jgi:quinol monooxygenase YgiN
MGNLILPMTTESRLYQEAASHLLMRLLQHMSPVAQVQGCMTYHTHADDQASGNH